MSTRALRKAQREREEQEQLRKLEEEQAGEEEDEDEADVPQQPAKQSAFAMLGGEEDEDDDDDGGARLDEDQEDVVPEEPTAPAPKKSAKKKKKKKKGKIAGDPASAAPAAAEEIDEIDRALKQLSTNGHAGSEGTTTSGTNPTVDETSRLLAVDTNNLHAQNEMRRLFGRAALEQQDDDDQPEANQAAGGNRRQQRRGQQTGLAQALRGQGGAGGRSGGLAAMALRRNIFIQGKEEWPAATGGGLGMEIEEKRADGTVLYRYVHNRAYQDVQAQFDTCVESMDPDRLVMLLRHNPYHISTLLQVSEIAKQERDHATSGDLLERALFSFGRAVHSTFAKNIAEGRARIDFARPENREFWLASWRYMQNLSMRATWRTVYEWAKLLLSLSPEDDPYGLWLVLDQYALRSRQDLDYLNMSRNPTFKAVHKDIPNVQLSQALAECRAGNKSKGQQALFTAIGRFPWVVNRLFQELAIQPPPAVWGTEARTDREKLYSELYATRAKDLWNTPEISALLTEIASAVPADTPSAPPDASNISLAEARHVLLSDTPALIALVPRSFTERMTSASDPLPPDENEISYTTPSSAQGSAAPGSSSTGSLTENILELQQLREFFARFFPYFNSNDGVAEDQDIPQEEVFRRLRESGVSPQDLQQRTHRLMQLRQQMTDQMADGDHDDLAAFGPGLTHAHAAGEQQDDEDPGEEHVHRARVDDAPEDEN